MPTVEYGDGTKIDFSGNPTPQNIEEAYNQSKGVAQQTPNAFDNIYSVPFLSEIQPDNPGTVKRDMVSDIGAGLARGVIQGGQSMVGSGVNVYELGSKLLGVKPSDVPRKFLEESQRGLDYFIPPSSTFTEAIASGVGQIPGMIATFSNPISKAIGAVPVAGLLGAVNAQQGGPTAMVGGAAEGMATLAILGKAQEMGTIPGGALGAATMAVPEIIHGGTPQEVAAQAVLGFGYAVVKPTTPKDIADFVSKVKNITPEYKERFEKFKDALSRDPLEGALKKKESLLQDVREKEAGLSVEQKETTIAIKNEFNKRKEQIIRNNDEVLNKTQQEELRRKNEVKRVCEDAASKINSEIDKYNNSDIPEESFQQAKFVQQNLPKIRKECSRVYNVEYDKVAEKIDNNPTSSISAARAREVLTSGAEKILNDTANENDPVLVKIHKLLEGDKYSADPVIGKNSTGRQIRMSMLERSDAATKQGAESIFAITEPKLYEKYIKLKARENSIPFKEFHADLKVIWNSAELGSHAAGLLRHTFGDFIAENVPEFQALQDAYKPVLDYNGYLNKVFQGYKTEANLEAGTNWLKQFAENKASPVDKRVLEFLQFGKVEGKTSEFTKGLGDKFMEKIVSLGSRLETMRNQALMLGDEQAARLDSIGLEFAKRTSDLKSQNALTQEQLRAEQEITIASLGMEIAKQRMQFELRKESLAGDKFGKAKIKEMIKKRDALEGRFKALSIIIGGLGSYRIGRIGMGLANLKRAMRHITK